MPARMAFGICGVVGAAGVVALLVLLARSSRRTLALPDEGPPAAAWNGGLRTGTINASVGVVRLEMFSW